MTNEMIRAPNATEVQRKKKHAPVRLLDLINISFDPVGDSARAPVLVFGGNAMGYDSEFC